MIQSAATLEEVQSLLAKVRAFAHVSPKVLRKCESTAERRTAELKRKP